MSEKDTITKILSVFYELLDGTSDGEDNDDGEDVGWQDSTTTTQERRNRGIFCIKFRCN